MNESLPYHHDRQNPFKTGHSSSRNVDDKDNDKNHSRDAEFNSKQRKRNQRERRNHRLTRKNESRIWVYKDRWGGDKRDYNTRHSQDRRRRYIRDESYNEPRDRYSYRRDMGAQESVENNPQNNGNYQENKERPSEIDGNAVANVGVEQSHVPQNEHPNSKVPKKTYFTEPSEPANDPIKPPNVVENVKNVNINIKTEKKDNEPKKDKSSSSSSSDSDESSAESAIKRLHTVVNSVLSTNPPKKPHQPKISIKKEKQSSSSSTSSDSSSDSDANTRKIAPPKTAPVKKSSSEEEVVCLGKMERKENLVDDEDEVEDMPVPMEDEKVCFLCEKPGHVAFQCFTVCKNCNGQYHGLKDCPKPPNISLVLQFFMQFCMDQVCKYDPSNKFNSNAYQQINPQLFSNYERGILSMGNISGNRRRKNSNDAGSSVSKASRRRREESSTEESESSSDETVKRKIKRRSKSVSDFDVPQQMPFTTAAYNAALPFAFNPSAMGMGPAMNPLLALGQMMGYNNSSLKRTSKSKKK